VRGGERITPDVMARQRFFFNLGLLGAAVLLIVAAVAFGPGSAKWVGLGIGIAGCLVSLLFVAALVHQRRFEGHLELEAFGRGLSIWSTLAGGMATVAVWEIVQAAVFAPNVSRWLTLANGLLIMVLSCAGLVAHETCTERVVHVIEVVQRPGDEAEV
jgi:uncharacterized transporter YbjL